VPHYELISLAVSILAVILAAASYVRTRVLGERQLKLEEATALLATKQLQLIEADQAARSTAKIEMNFVPDGKHHRLVIKNIGGVEARDIGFGFEGKGNPLVGTEYKDKIPIASLRPGQSVALQAIQDLETDHKYIFNVHWINADGKGAQDRITVYW
jgi:hypothetical protein